MLPWGHLAVAYLLLRFGSRRWAGRAPSGPAVVVAAVASQGPDLVDKPLGWSLEVLPGGRTLGHSVFVGVVVLAVAAHLARTGRADVGYGLAIGHLSHLAVDLPLAVLAGDLREARYLLWPLVAPVVDYPDPDSVLGFLLAASTEAGSVAQFAILGVAGLLWWRDGRPGLESCRRGWRRLVAPG